MQKKQLFNYVAIPVLTMAMWPTLAQAQVDEIIVTATKRAESAQDVAVAVTALGEEFLEEQRVDVFTDYLLQLPGVNAGGSGPGQSTIFIRGIASTAPNLTSSGIGGLAPNVALYLDEQPVTQVGRNLDVYAVDLNRVEVLPGPQGTLFGGSSQAGTIRLITNAPKLGVEEAKMSFGASFTEGGDESFKAEATYNFPIGDNAAIRATVFGDVQGGYIDNVPGVFDIRDNAQLAGRADFSQITGGRENNDQFVEDNFNDASYSGFRVSGLYEFNDDWSARVTHMSQDIDSEGVFFADPELDSDLTSIQRYADDTIDDDFSNTAWTLKGRLSMLDIVYTGAFNKRRVDQRAGYTDYNFVGPFIPYYTCDYDTAAGANVYNPNVNAGNCSDPRLFADIANETDTSTHEFRFTTPAEHRLRATAGVFYSDQEIIERVDFTYPGAIGRVAPNDHVPNATITLAGPRDPGVVFFNDLIRTDEQLGFFGEVTFDLIPDVLSVTGGARNFDVEVDFVGSSNFGTLGPVDGDAGRSLDEVLPPPSVSDGTILKGNISWTPNSDVLLYATYSEGFRPGILNRPPNRPGGVGVVQDNVTSDDVNNYELGWKTRLMDNQLQFNGSAFFVDISGLQTGIFDAQLSSFFFAANAVDAEVKGVEADFIWAPVDIDGLTVNGAVSILDSQITDILVLTPAGPTTSVVPVGSSLSYSPSFQANLSARYEWSKGDYTPYVQASGSYSSSAFSDIVQAARRPIDSYFLLGATAGFKKDGWGMELFVSNLTDERAQLSNSFVFRRDRISINRPRTWGMRASFDFQ